MTILLKRETVGQFKLILARLMLLLIQRIWFILEAKTIVSFMSMIAFTGLPISPFMRVASSKILDIHSISFQLKFIGDAMKWHVVVFRVQVV